jgi:thiosulfate/3-mercaptopyruvate sulfurtransferase
VSCHWLSQPIEDDNLLVLFSPMLEPITPDNADPIEGYIQGSVLFDFEKVFCEKHSHLPHTLPSREVFTQEMQKLGIEQNTVLVIYDAKGIYSAPLVEWMCQVMGHRNSFILDGGLPDWLKAGLPIQSPLSHRPGLGNFRAKFNDKAVIETQALLKQLEPVL